MDYEFVIIGGGAAGLSAAIRLTELGARPLLVDAGNYPAHKVCGEFFSPASLPPLEKWLIDPIRIHKMNFHTPSVSIEYRFPFDAGSLSHWQFDEALAKLATSQGAVVLTDTKVDDIERDNYYKIQLSTGKKICTPNLIVATGRIPNLLASQPLMKFVGIKAHFETIPLHNTLEMFSFDGAYAGISPVEENKCNVACLAAIELFNQFKNASHLMQHLREQNLHFDHYLSQGKRVMKEWMTTFIPEFGIKTIPSWPDANFIGDAIGTTPPITGNGLSMAIHSGIMAADFAVKRDSKGFHQAWIKRFKKPIAWGKAFHYIAMKPGLGHPLIQFTRIAPYFKKLIFRLTR